MNAQPASLVFVVPGELGTLTGGYAYDRQIIAGLADAGWSVDVRSLGAGFPWPDATTRQSAADLIAALPDGQIVIVDGLAFGALPEIAERHRRRLRWVALVHHPLALETGIDVQQAQSLFDSERRALAAARLVVVTSASTAQSLARYDVAASRVVVVEPGTAVGESSGCAAGGATVTSGAAAMPRAPSPSLSPTPVAPAALSLLCVATLTRRKGHALLFEALADLADRRWTLHCVGSQARDPQTARELQAMLRDLGLSDRVILHGELDDRRLQACYAQADAFVLASYHEGYGMALAEALAHGLPVISTTAGAIATTVPAQAGLLVAPGDVTALRGALARLLDEPALRGALAAGARQAAAKLPGWPQAVGRFDAALRTLST